MGKPILSPENYEMPTDNEQSKVALLVALKRACKNPVISLRLDTKGRKSWKNTTVLTDLEEAEIEFSEPEIVHRHTNSLCSGAGPIRGGS